MADRPAASVELPLRSHLHRPVAPDKLASWLEGWGRWDRPFFPNVVGLELVDLRMDYARMRLAYRPELEQPAGVIHGGAIATLIDTVVVPAVASPFEVQPRLLTVDMQVRYLSAARGVDLVAEGWVTKRGSSIAFCQAAVWETSGAECVAEGWMVYRIIAPTTGEDGAH